MGAGRGILDVGAVVLAGMGTAAALVAMATMEYGGDSGSNRSAVVTLREIYYGCELAVTLVFTVMNNSVYRVDRVAEVVIEVVVHPGASDSLV